MAGRRRVSWWLAGAMLIALCLPASVLAAPTVTLDSPPNGSVLTSPQPTFAGTASTSVTASANVTVRVYPGPVASGTPFETLTTVRASTPSGSYSVVSTFRLPDGTYTAQAEQDDVTAPLTGAGLSAPVTFAVNTTAPRLVLNPPGSNPSRTATPGLTGSASTAPGDTRSVVVAIFPGSSAQGSPVRFVGAPVGAGGAFSMTVAPGLADGLYTAVAGQRGIAGSGLSNPVTFRIKAHPPVATILSPRPGGSLPGPRPAFSGTAGSTLGDAPLVAVTLHAGRSPGGRSLGRQIVAVRGGQWALRWPRRVPLGAYTLVIAQSDDAGHTTTVWSTFRLVAAPRLIGSRVTLSGSSAAIRIGCAGPPGATCRGTVLALTAEPLQTRAGGPVGPVRLLFAYVAIPAGHSQSVRGTLAPYVVHALRRVRHLKARVTVSFAFLPRGSAIRPVS